MNFHNFLMITAGLLVIVGCNTAPPKADIPSTAAPQEEITKLNNDIESSISSHVDVLAPKDFKEAQSWLNEAKADMASNQKQEEVIDDIRQGRGYLSRAMGLTADRTPQVAGILEARAAAMAAGVRNFSKLSERFKTYDDELRDYSASLNKLDSNAYGEMQRNYMNLELAAIQEANLGQARGIIGGSIKSKAEKVAPKSLSKAQIDLKSAENAIVGNRKNPEGYSAQVSTANSSALFLQNVVATLRSHKDMDEKSAAEMVRKNMQISDLKENLKEVSDETSDANQKLRSQNQQLQEANKTISVQETIEAARKEFDSSEAEVFQQGDKLVVRLKSMRFPSGRSELPPESLALLAKVKDVAQSLNPSGITVEGHTDSTGKANLNKKLSEKRAETVATYLRENGLSQDKIEAVGYGFEKPIASNKSSEGRSQNRRVDVVITPAAVE